MGFDFGTKPRGLGEHLTRAGMNRAEAAVDDAGRGDTHALERIIDDNSRAGFGAGLVAGAMFGVAGALLRRRR